MGGSTTQPMGASSLMGGANPMGQGAPQGQQEAQQRYDMAGGQGAPPMLPPGMMSGAGKGAVNPGAPGNYPLPPGYGSGQGAPQSMNGFKDGGSVDTVIQNALRLLSNRN